MVVKKDVVKIAYFDEVKYEKGKQSFYWLGGIVVDAKYVQKLERSVDDLAEEYFGNRLLTRGTEFHASDICHRKSNFKDEKDHGKRSGLLKRLMAILSDSEIARICVRLEPDRMYKSLNQIPSMAFMYFVEQVESYLAASKDIGILIGDRESAAVSKDFVTALSHYRTYGTSYQMGIELKHLIDTVHFTESHHSRMLQLADAFVWLYQFAKFSKETNYNTELKAVINKSELVNLARYKEFPTPYSWLQLHS